MSGIMQRCETHLFLLPVTYELTVRPVAHHYLAKHHRLVRFRGYLATHPTWVTQAPRTTCTYRLAPPVKRMKSFNHINDSPCDIIEWLSSSQLLRIRATCVCHVYVRSPLTTPRPLRTRRHFVVRSGSYPPCLRMCEILISFACRAPVHSFSSMASFTCMLQCKASSVPQVVIEPRPRKLLGAVGDQPRVKYTCCDMREAGRKRSCMLTA
jgi:hypothetical protein